MKRSYIKQKHPKTSKIRQAALGQDCTLRLPYVCNYNTETTVLCHSNLLVDGRGMGLKAKDERACFGCSSCHDVLDGRTPSAFQKYELINLFNEAVLKTHVVLKNMGLIGNDE